MALFRYATKDDLANLKFAPTQDQTRMYDAFTRTNNPTESSDDNFFTKKWKSLDNAIGTTGAAVVSRIDSAIENKNNEERNKRWNQSMDDIYKAAGYNDMNEYYDAKDEASRNAFNKIGFDYDAHWDNRADADLRGDKETVARLDQEYQDALSRLTGEDADIVNRFENIQNQLKNRASSNANEAKKAAQDWKDYRENSDVGKRINQDRGKFLGSAMNTLSTAADVMLPGAGVAFNAGQGAWEGIADELEQNGLENFDWGRAGQNALIGATSGAVTGAFNKGLNTAMAKNGGKLFAGNNIITKGINKIGDIPGPQNLLGKTGENIVNTVGTGTLRGAASGAVGGATGAGLSAAMNGQDVLGSALQGAQQGFRQGAMTGGIMAGANMALNATPGVRNVMQGINDAGENWRNSGDTFAERMKNTWDSGDSVVANAAKNIGEGFNNIGESMKSGKMQGYVRLPGSDIGGAEDVVNKIIDLNTQARNNPGMVEEYNNQAKQLLDSVSVKDLDDAWNREKIAIQDSWLNNGGKTYRQISDEFQKAGFELDADPNNPVKKQAFKEAEREYNEWDSNVNQKLKSISRRYRTLLEAKDPNWLDTIRNNTQPQQDIVQPPIENTKMQIPVSQENESFGVPIRFSNNVENEQQLNTRVNTPETPNNMRLSNPPETEMYRTLSGDTSEPFMAYGESDLANRTRRGMLADSLERFGNTLEGAQTNVTRAARKDIGVKNTGQVIENVRKKTGLTNLETQAQFAKELTGGENSLMDRVQQNAIYTREDGTPYRVDTTPVIDEVENIVNKYADSNTFGSQKAKEQFIYNLKRDISNDSADVLGISNRMKATAADLRGKGVGEVPPKDKAQSRIYSEIANKLDDLSYSVIPQESVGAMFDATINEMRARATQARNNGNNKIAVAYETAASRLDEEPRTIKAFRTFKKDFVDVSKIDNLTAMAENGAAAQMGRSFGGGVKRFASTFAQRPVNALLAKAGGVVNNLADKIDNGRNVTDSVVSNSATTATEYNPATQIYNMLGRAEGERQGEQQRVANYLVDSAQEGGLENPDTGTDMLPNNTSSTGLYNALTGNSGTGMTTSSGYTMQPSAGVNSIEEERAVYFFPPTGDYWSDMLSRAMRRAKNAEDYEAMGSLYEMYQNQLANLQKQQSSSTSSQKLTATQQRANAAMNALQEISGMTPDLGYNLSNIPIIGNIATFGGNSYEGAAKSLAQQIGYMVSGANIKEEEAYNIGKSYVPQPFDSEEERQRKLQRAYNIIRQYQNGVAEEA